VSFPGNSISQVLQRKNGAIPVFLLIQNNWNRFILYSVDSQDAHQSIQLHFTLVVVIYFIITARGLLTDEIRADLEKLKGFQFANHPRIPISEKRLELLSAIVRRQIGLILK
jgi:hypothetical protein